MLAYVHIYIRDPEMVIMILSVGRLFTEIEPAGAAALLEVWQIANAQECAHEDAEGADDTLCSTSLVTDYV